MEVDEKYMTQAINEARKALAEGEIPIGCVIAEIQAITAAAQTLGGKYLTDCSLYVTVEPCAMCAGAIGWAQVARLVYGCTDEKRGYTTFAPKALHPKTSVKSGILDSDCRQLMQDFFANKR